MKGNYQFWGSTSKILITESIILHIAATSTGYMGGILFSGYCFATFDIFSSYFDESFRETFKVYL